ALLAEELWDLKSTRIFCTTCPAHWMNFQNSCYFFSFKSKPWKIAQQFCEDEGANLVIVNSGIEQNFLVKHMGNDQVFWIGLTDTDKENHWIWVDNTTLSVFWGKDEPNNAGSGEDCATLRFSGKWNDPCSCPRQPIAPLLLY
uniref:C-type lectin domain-containing protein n=1 Tax=Pseudonaja textilis TaxID=8673 RepID=A0A670YI81_PSETE